MGLRKQPPPRLQNIGNSNTRSEARSPKSASPSSASPSRTAHLRRVPSADSIYSPDLNTSPAFNLMPIEEAQRSPVGSPSHPPTSWPDGARRSEHGAVNQYPQHDQYNGTHEDLRDNPQTSNPPFSYQNTGESENVWQTGTHISAASTEELSLPLRSNNPFLKPRSAEHTHDLRDQNEWARTSQATTDSAALSHSMSNIFLFTWKVLLSRLWALTISSRWIYTDDCTLLSNRRTRTRGRMGRASARFRSPCCSRGSSYG